MPCDATVLVKWRKRMKEEGMEFLLQETLAIASEAKLLKPKDEPLMRARPERTQFDCKGSAPTIRELQPLASSVPSRGPILGWFYQMIPNKGSARLSSRQEHWPSYCALGGLEALVLAL